MTEAEGVQLLEELIKVGGLQFHDLVIKESRRVRRPAEKAARTQGRKGSVKTASHGSSRCNSATKRGKRPAKAVKAHAPVKAVQYKPSAKRASLQLIGPGGDLSKLATASGVPRDGSYQVGTDQRPAPVEQAPLENSPAKPKRSATGKPSMKVVL